MFLQFWAMRAAKARAALSAASLYRRHGRSFSPPVLVDIGARGGLQRKWRAYRRLAPLLAIMVEADPDEARKLQQNDPQATIVATALGAQAGTATLYVTSEPGCSSLLRPTAQAQALPSIGYRLGIVRTIEMALSRADTVFQRDGLPQPDFLKLDTQGTEMSILQGFGALLDKVIGIEIECEFQRLYEDQPLITDVVAFLQARGFALVAMRPNGVGEDGILDTNGFFVRKEILLDARQKILAEVWRRLNRIPDHFSYVIASG